MLRIRLFGRLHIRHDELGAFTIESRKAQELFCYLLLYRSRPHLRELLAGKLWGEVPQNQLRANFRKTLCQLQQSLPDATLLLDSDWVQIHPQAEICLDVAAIELALERVHGRLGESLSDSEAREIAAALKEYQGDLIEDCYADWCLFERERLQALYLALLDKLVAYCDACGDYETGIRYGTTILRYDRAHEQTHRRLMRLYVLAGDRTTALRQYGRCVAALREELDTEPTELTRGLMEQIRANTFAPQPAPLPAVDLSRMINNLRHTYGSLLEAQSLLHRQIVEVEELLARSP